MQNKTKEFLNRNLIEGKWYLISYPELNILEPVKYSIEEKGNEAEHGLLSNGTHRFDDVYHRNNIEVFTLDLEIPKRQKINLEIVKKLEEYFKKYPDIRFFQALHNLNIIEVKNGEIVDKFYEESATTLNRMLESEKD